MASITIRNLDPEVKQALRVRAAMKGRSMEEEVRVLLSEGVAVNIPKSPLPNKMSDVLADIQRIVEEAGGFDIVRETDPPLDFSTYDKMFGSLPLPPTGEAA